jgi:hypothetical protein
MVLQRAASRRAVPRCDVPPARKRSQHSLPCAHHAYTLSAKRDTSREPPADRVPRLWRRCELLQKVPPSALEIFKTGSYEPAAQLHEVSTHQYPPPCPERRSVPITQGAIRVPRVPPEYALGTPDY